MGQPVVALPICQIRGLTSVSNRDVKCDGAARTGLIQKHSARQRETARASRIVTRRREDWDLTEKDTAATTATTATTSTTLAVVAAPDTALIIAAAAEADSPASPAPR
jgi:hypothetical protein